MSAFTQDTNNSYIDLVLNKKMVAKKLPFVALIAAVFLAVSYGAMVGAAYMGMPAYVGLIVPTVINMTAGWRTLSAGEMVTSTMFNGVFIGAIYYEPMGPEIAGVIALVYAAFMMAVSLHHMVLTNKMKFYKIELKPVTQ